MKSTIITIVIIAVFVIYLGKTTISLSPFKITMQRPLESLGFVFLILALGCMKAQSNKDGQKQGQDETIKKIVKNFTLTEKQQ